MLQEIGWHHPVDESDQWDGFNDSGIALYAGKPLKNLAREVIQNALDAGENECVRVQIVLHKISPSSIPNLPEFKKNLEACLNSSKNESKNAQLFFENALNELGKDAISVLEISDFNTKGMQGPSRNGTPYYAFMKAKGQSKKDSSVATGSYGIGKFAPYAASQIRTIFVSTVFQSSSGEHQQYTQGKSVLMSHDLDGKRKTGVGFWGIKELCQPVEGVPNNLPGWLLRVRSVNEISSNRGSKLSVVCFDDAEHWQAFLAMSVAENFFGAISLGKLEVDIDNKFNLNRRLIESFFQNNNLKELAQDNEPERFDNARHFLMSLQDNNNVIEEESEMAILGRCQLRLIVAEGLPKRICILRNGMFITDYLPGLKRFPDFKEFVGVFQCMNDKGNELLRSMEPPRHDGFDPERLIDKDEQRRGKKALKDISEWAREMLKRHAKEPIEDITEIDELREFFGEEGGFGEGKGEDEVNPYGNMTIRARPVKPKSQQQTPAGEITLAGGEYNGDEISGSSESSGDGGGSGGSADRDGPEERESSGGVSGGSTVYSQVNIENIRAVPSGEKSRRLFFTPKSTGQIVLRIFEAGADADFETAVSESDEGRVQDGKVFLDVESGNRKSLNIELSKPVIGAVKVSAYEVR